MEVSSGGGTAYPRENWGWGHACLALASCRCVLLSFVETSGAHPLVSPDDIYLQVPARGPVTSCSLFLQPWSIHFQGRKRAFRVGNLDQETF